MSAYKPTNSSGKLSLFWAAQIRGPGALGKVISLSTKIREKRPAIRLSRLWERVAELARNGHLTHEKAQSILFTDCLELLEQRVVCPEESESATSLLKAVEQKEPQVDIRRGSSSR